MMRNTIVPLHKYNSDIFYPILFYNSIKEHETIIRPLYPEAANSPYNWNSIHFLYNGCGYQDIPHSFKLISYSVYDPKEIIIGSVVCGNLDGYVAVYVRGGKDIVVTSTIPMFPEHYISTGYTSENGEVYKPGSTYTGETVNTTLVWQHPY